jgi:hypothetical protein
MVKIIPPTIMKNGSVVDSVHINTLLSFARGGGGKIINYFRNTDKWNNNVR